MAQTFSHEYCKIFKNSFFLKTLQVTASDGYLVTINTEKAFDSLDHDFIMAALEKFRLKPNFIDRIMLFLNG